MPVDFDVIVIGGGINGTGVANLAAQSGLSVLLTEQDDLAAHTSSRSSKLIHGGLRYLEQYEFRLVREALTEREVLMSMAPHIIWPLNFVLPLDTATRPAWMIRAGLFLYDHIGGRKLLPKSRQLKLRQSPLGEPLQPQWSTGFSYADCWVDDARLVLLNALQAEEFGASILTRTQFKQARRVDGLWQLALQFADGSCRDYACRALVNAAGPWVARVLGCIDDTQHTAGVRLIKGSHIVVPRLYQGDQAYILQHDDKRVVFALPYGEYNLVGTTDIPFEGQPTEVGVDAAEVEYLCQIINRYFKRQITSADVAWRYAGVRALYDDGAKHASKVTRDYKLECDVADNQAPLVSVFGGKITTYRQLALSVMNKLLAHFPEAMLPAEPPAPLPGGVLPTADIAAYQHDLAHRYPVIPHEALQAMVRRHGSRCDLLLRDVNKLGDLGLHFGAGLYQREVEFMRAEEWATMPEDVLWRRTKCGLRMSEQQREDFARWWAVSSCVLA